MYEQINLRTALTLTIKVIDIPVQDFIAILRNLVLFPDFLRNKMSVIYRERRP